MANTIKIKRGSGAPSSLEYGELGVSSSNVLYVGDSDGSVQELNTLDALDAMSRTDPTGTGSFSLNRKADTTVAAYSFAEGYDTEASGYGSHAEGVSTVAYNEGCHAEGLSTFAIYSGSHAEGNSTVARSFYSHAEGYHTIAASDNQHAQGKCNIEDAAGKYAHIVGNGTLSRCSNAHTLDWDGNGWFAGDVYVGSTSGTNKDDGSKKLVTYDDVYPIGSIYMSTSSTSPASMFGGTWQQITERFLFAASQLNEDGTVNEDATYPAGKVDGAATHTLTIDEAPKHYHYMSYMYGARGGISSSSLIQVGSTDSTGGNIVSSDHLWRYYTDTRGGGGAHNNMPPYLAVYIWQRVEDTTES